MWKTFWRIIPATVTTFYIFLSGLRTQLSSEINDNDLNEL